MRPLFGLSAFCLVLVFSIAACSDDPEVSIATTDGSYLNHGPDARYVGKEQCKTCHEDVYTTFVQSQMGRSFREGKLSNSDANFLNPSPIYDPETDMYYQPFHRGEDIFVKEYRVNGRDTTYQRIEQIDYIVGSGHHTNSHMREENGYLYQVPVTWYVQEGKWHLAPKFGGNNINPRFDRSIPAQCMNCHNARPEFVPASENRFTSVPFGIDCEQCHGPGSIHIEQKLAGVLVDTSNAIDYSIVHPGKLPIDRQLDICQNCHMQGASVFQPGKTALDFRPGMNLLDIQNVYWPRYADSTEAFIMASHPDRMRMSACFQVSHAPGSRYKPMTCITCHNPHLSISDQRSDPRMTNGCQSCHNGPDDTRCSESMEVRNIVGDNCASCHMPTSGTTDIPHVRITDHFTRIVPPEKRSVGEPTRKRSDREFIRMASLLKASPSHVETAQGYLASFETVTNDPEFLDSAAVYLEKAGAIRSTTQLAGSLIQLWFWQQEYQKIADLVESSGAISLTDPWTAYRIGEAYFGLQRLTDSAAYLETAVNSAPDHLRFRSKLAQVYSASGREADAVRLYDKILADNSTLGEVYNNRGFAFVRTGDLQRAESDFRRALDLDPDSRQALGNLASLYFNTNRVDEARPLARRLLRMEPSNEQYQMLWDAINNGQ